jgi:hypothetical protein
MRAIAVVMLLVAVTMFSGCCLLPKCGKKAACPAPCPIVMPCEK